MKKYILRLNRDQLRKMQLQAQSLRGWELKRARVQFPVVEGLELHFSQLVPVEFKRYIFTTLEFTTPGCRSISRAINFSNVLVLLKQHLSAAKTTP